MACYHFALKHKPKGFAKAHALYIMREGKYENLRSEEVMEEKQSGNMPSWADSPEDFWSTADEYERLNARVYSEMEVALPNELSAEQRKELVADFVKEHLGDNYVYTYCIHNKKAALDNTVEQPHAHIMFSQRKLDGIERDRELFFKRANSKAPERGGTKKAEEWQAQDKVLELRKSWAEIQNNCLEKYGHDVRVDHRTLAEQKKEALTKGDVLKAEFLDRPADIHLGPKIIRQATKEQAKITRENPEMTSEQVENKYINECSNEKISYSLAARRLRKIKQELVQEYPDFVLEEIADRKLFVPENTEKIEERLSVLKQELASIKEKQTELSSEVKTERDIQNIARVRSFGRKVTADKLADKLNNEYNRNRFNKISEEIRTANKDTRQEFINLTYQEKILLTEKSFLESGKNVKEQALNDSQINYKVFKIFEMYSHEFKVKEFSHCKNREEADKRLFAINNTLNALKKHQQELAGKVKLNSDAHGYAVYKVFGKEIRAEGLRLDNNSRILEKEIKAYREAVSESNMAVADLRAWKSGIDKLKIINQLEKQGYELKISDEVKQQQVKNIEKIYLLNTEDDRRDFYNLSCEIKDLEAEKNFLENQVSRKISDYELNQKSEFIQDKYADQLKDEDEKIILPDKRSLVYHELKKVKAEIKQVLEEKRELARFIKTDEDIEREVKRVLSTPEIRKSAAEFTALNKKYKEALKEFESQPKPGLLNFKAKKAWENRKNELEKMKAELDARGMIAKNLIAKSKADNAEKVERIRRDMKAASLASEKKILNFERRYMHLMKQRKALQHRLNTLPKAKSRKYIYRSRCNQPKRAVVKGSVNNISRAVKGIREERCLGGVQARIIRNMEENER